MAPSRVVAINPMSAYGHGRGHIQTCLNLMHGMQKAGGDVTLFARRVMVDVGELVVRTAIPRPISRFHHPTWDKLAVDRTYRLFERSIRPGDMCWMWPPTHLPLYREVAAHGNPIIMEGINSRMAYARTILDEAFRSEGMAPRHGIRDESIAEEEEMLSLATHFFAPSPFVEKALTAPDSAFRGKVLSSGYGTWRPTNEALAALRKTAPKRDVPNFFFAGTLCLRKGVHHLLRAWAQASPKATLTLVGHMMPEIEELCASELDRSDVHLMGFSQDIATDFANADVFVLPSLEEGSPQVTAEAAGYGLPILASLAGAGRLADAPTAPWIIDPRDIDTLASAIQDLADNADLRADLATKSREASKRVDWDALGAARVEHLYDDQERAAS